MTFSIPLTTTIDAALAADVEKQAVYSAPQLKRVTVSGQRVDVELDGDAPEREVRPKVERYVAAMIERYRHIKANAVAVMTRADDAPLESDVFQRLVERGWAQPFGHGLVGLSGPALAIARHLDEAWRAIGREEFAAAERSYPTLVDADVLARCGYFAAFPHAVSFVANLSEDFDLIEEFRAANADTAALRVPNQAAFALPKKCAKPAVCYHCYQELQGRRLDAPGLAFTAAGKCYRYESKNLVGLERLWDFTMREIVFVGEEDWVRSRRQRMMRRIEAQIREWEVDCVFETANDPFFASMYASKTFWQMCGDLKYEMKVAVEPAAAGEARRIAAGSFNLHEDFFGKAFDITCAGRPAFSACTAWGVERWVLALFAQHGLEPARWPATLRAQAFGSSRE
jgi:hypothetical protein